MNHEEASQLWTEYLDRTLHPDVEAQLEEHMKTCVVCRREIEELKRSVNALSGLHKLSAPVDLSVGVADRIRKRSRGRFFAKRDRVPYQMFSLVMLAILLAVYVALSMLNPATLKLP